LHQRGDALAILRMIKATVRIYDTVKLFVGPEPRLCWPISPASRPLLLWLRRAALAPEAALSLRNVKAAITFVLLCLPALADLAAGVQAYINGDYSTALKEFLPLAKQGDATAQHNLGVMYDRGQGVRQDYVEAAKWWRMAAQQGNSAAQFNLGLMYDEGHGIEQNYQEAVKWYSLAAKQGYADAQYNLGLKYYFGKGVAQDYKNAAKWIRLAAEQGNAEAQNNLAVMYDQGQGVEQDYEEAVKWYRSAAEQGFAGAQFNLGVMYAHGKGVPQNYVQAHMWFNLAGADGDADTAKIAVKNRDELARKMTPAQVEEAQQLAREWKPKARP